MASWDGASPYWPLRASMAAMPSVPAPIGGKPTWPKVSSRGLSARLMKSCVVRLFGPALANTRVPRRLERRTGASRMDRAHFRVGRQAELHHKPLDHAKESGTVEEAGLHQAIEALGAERGPVLMHEDRDGSAARRQRDDEAVRYEGGDDRRGLRRARGRVASLAAKR